MCEAVISVSPSVHLSFSGPISFCPHIQHAAQPCGREDESKQRARLVMQNQQSIVFVKQGELFKQSVIIHLASSLSPCPPFPIFPGEKIMWLCRVISLKLHTSDSPERCVCLHICLRCVWASVGVLAANGSIGGERLALGVGGL